jgi:hypothetical protein
MTVEETLVELPALLQGLHKLTWYRLGRVWAAGVLVPPFLQRLRAKSDVMPTEFY